MQSCVYIDISEEKGVYQKYDEIQKVLVYEENGIIIAEIYPNEE